MRQESIASRRNNPLDSVSLVRTQRLHCIRSIDSQVRAIIFWRHNGIEGLIVEFLQLVSSGFILPQPLLEFLLNVFDFLICRRCCIFVDNRSTIRILVSDNDTFGIQHSVIEVQERALICSPLLQV